MPAQCSNVSRRHSVSASEVVRTVNLSSIYIVQIQNVNWYTYVVNGSKYVYTAETKNTADGPETTAKKINHIRKLRKSSDLWALIILLNPQLYTE